MEQREKKKKMSYAERKEWETIEADIEKIETTIEATEAEMASAGSDYDKLRELTATLEELNMQDTKSYLNDGLIYKNFKKA